MDSLSKTLVIVYPNGTKQRCKPMSGFNGDWYSLAYSIAGEYFPEIKGQRIINYYVE